MRANAIALALLVALPLSAQAQQTNRVMDSAWWVSGGTFLANRDLEASAKGSGGTGDREFDLEESLGLDDSTDLFMGEFGWKFSRNWDVGLQYFRASRDAKETIDESFEWQGNVYDVGATISAETSTEITRLFFSRKFVIDGPHSLRVGAGLHFLKIQAEISGEATLEDQSTGFRRSTAKTEFPIPNIGAKYQWAMSERWLLNARVDWLSASIEEYSGGIWNVSGGVNYSVSDHFAIGGNYQFFRISGDVKDNQWKGEIKTTFTGPYLYLMGYW